MIFPTISRFSSVFEKIEILDLVCPSGWAAGRLGGWMAGWLDGWMAGYFCRNLGVKPGIIRMLSMRRLRKSDYLKTPSETGIPGSNPGGGQLFFEPIKPPISIFIIDPREKLCTNLEKKSKKYFNLKIW